MAVEEQWAGDEKPIEELLNLQHVAQTAPIHELAQDVALMFTQLADSLHTFNKLVTHEPCTCGLTPADIQESVITVTMLSIHIAIYCLAIGQRNPGGFSVALGPLTWPDLN